jgi:hypothetical protein
MAFEQRQPQLVGDADGGAAPAEYLIKISLTRS